MWSVWKRVDAIKQLIVLVGLDSVWLVRKISRQPVVDRKIDKRGRYEVSCDEFAEYTVDVYRRTCETLSVMPHYTTWNMLHTGEIESGIRRCLIIGNIEGCVVPRVAECFGLVGPCPATGTVLADIPMLTVHDLVPRRRVREIVVDGDVDHGGDSGTCAHHH